jgi:hypothetical protein
VREAGGVNPGLVVQSGDNRSVLQKIGKKSKLLQNILVQILGLVDNQNAFSSLE